MRILIIGGTSFMGPQVVRLLHGQGHQITLFHRGKTKMELPAGVQELVGDRRPMMPVADSLRRVKPEVVLDMIPATERDALEVMSIFSGVARRMVAISSQDVYQAFGRVNRKEVGPVDLRPITEESPLRENLFPYRGFDLGDNEDMKSWQDDYDKILVERVVMGDPALPGTILRLPMVYGPRDLQHRTFPFLKRMDDKRSVILLDETVKQWRWTHGYVENVAVAIALAVTDERAKGRIYNVGEPFTFTMIEWIQKIGTLAGWSGRVVSVPQERLPESLRDDINGQQDIVVDSSRIRQELGYKEQVDSDEALRRTIAWERAHPPTTINPQMFDYALEDSVVNEMM